METSFLPSPFPSLKQGQLALISGTQGSGRTSLLLKILDSFLKQNRHCRWFSNTDSLQSLNLKLSAINNDYNESEVIFQDSCFNLKSLQINTKKAVDEGIKVFFIDSLFGFDFEHSNPSLDDQIGYLGRWLKEFAVQNEVMVFATTPISNEIGSREGKHPYITDIPASPLLTEMADVVILLHRPELFGICENENGSSLEGIVELFVAKSNSGRISKVEMKIDPDVPTINFTDKEAQLKNFN